MRCSMLDDKLSSGMCFFELLADGLDAIDQDLAAAAPNEDVFDDFVQAFEPGGVG